MAAYVPQSCLRPAVQNLQTFFRQLLQRLQPHADPFLVSSGCRAYGRHMPQCRTHCTQHQQQPRQHLQQCQQQVLQQQANRGVQLLQQPSGRLQPHCRCQNIQVRQPVLSTKPQLFTCNIKNSAACKHFSSGTNSNAWLLARWSAGRPSMMWLQQRGYSSSSNSGKSTFTSLSSKHASWQSWMRQQLGSNGPECSSSSSNSSNVVLRAYSSLTHQSGKAAAAAAHPAGFAGATCRAMQCHAATAGLWQCTSKNAGIAAAIAGLRFSRLSAAAAVTAGRRAVHTIVTKASTAGVSSSTTAGWWDSWVYWVSSGTGYTLASLLNALNLVGNKLPVALGLLLVDMAHNSPLFGGSLADSWDPAVLPDKVPPGGYYAAGGAAGAAAAADGATAGQVSGSRGLTQQVWQEALSAFAAGARLIWLGFIWFPTLASAPLVLWSGIGRDWWLVLLRVSLEFSGPAFIKWGQWAATRHDIFPHDVCAALEKLHTNAPAHGFRYTCNVLRKSFGLPPKELFDWIEEKPIACGSIGQVHRGRLSAKGAALTGCEPGDTVAIKVRHPGVSEAIERDFATMVWLAHVAVQLAPAARSLRLDETLKQFAAPLHEQVDLSREAAHLKRFNKNFKRSRAVTFPLPLYPLVSPDVLVETFEPGRHISHYITAAEGGHPYRRRLAELGSGTMLQMMLVDNFIHSDLHPGNILVRLEAPRGLLGLLYRTLYNMSNPNGRVIRALNEALGNEQEQKSGQPATQELNTCGASYHLRTARYNSGSNSSQEQQSGSAAGQELPVIHQLQQMASWARAAVADPVAALHEVQVYAASVAAAWLQPHLVLLDVGMATELTTEDQTNMVGLFSSFAVLDGTGVAEWVLRFSGPDQACPEPQAFIDDMQATFETLKKTIAAHQAAAARWKRRQAREQQRQEAAAAVAAAAAVQTTNASSSSSSWHPNSWRFGGESNSSSSSIGDNGDGDEDTVSQAGSSNGTNGSTALEMPEQFDSGAEALATVLELVRLHGVSLPGHICAVVVTTLILEGWSNKLAPEHSVLRQVRGMFSPAMYSWHDRMDTVVDVVMDRGDSVLAFA